MDHAQPNTVNQQLEELAALRSRAKALSTQLAQLHLDIEVLSNELKLRQPPDDQNKQP